LRAQPRFARLPIVAVTAFAMKGDEQKALDAGCNGYITKPIDTRRLPAQVAQYLAAQATEAQRLNVMIVEDHRLDLKLAGDRVRLSGHFALDTTTAEEAIDSLELAHPDVVLLDLNLPGMDGYGVLQHLRSRPGTVNVPVIVLTAKGDEDNEVRVLKLGADDFLTKPFRARALSARLESVISRRRSAR
jgi:two-component system cell cycle response regulator